MGKHSQELVYFVSPFAVTQMWLHVAFRAGESYTLTPGREAEII